MTLSDSSYNSALHVKLYPWMYIKEYSEYANNIQNQLYQDVGAAEHLT